MGEIESSEDQQALEPHEALALDVLSRVTIDRPDLRTDVDGEVLAAIFVYVGLTRTGLVGMLPGDGVKELPQFWITSRGRDALEKFKAKQEVADYEYQK